MALNMLIYEDCIIIKVISICLTTDKTNEVVKN